MNESVPLTLQRMLPITFADSCFDAKEKAFAIRSICFYSFNVNFKQPLLNIVQYYNDIYIFNLKGIYKYSILYG